MSEIDNLLSVVKNVADRESQGDTTDPFFDPFSLLSEGAKSRKKWWEAALLQRLNSPSRKFKKPVPNPVVATKSMVALRKTLHQEAIKLGPDHVAYTLGVSQTALLRFILGFGVSTETVEHICDSVRRMREWATTKRQLRVDKLMREAAESSRPQYDSAHPNRT